LVVHFCSVINVIKRNYINCGSSQQLDEAKGIVLF